MASFAALARVTGPDGFVRALLYRGERLQCTAVLAGLGSFAHFFVGMIGLIS